MPLERPALNVVGARYQAVDLVGGNDMNLFADAIFPISLTVRAERLSALNARDIKRSWKNLAAQGGSVGNFHIEPDRVILAVICATLEISGATNPLRILAVSPFSTNWLRWLSGLSRLPVVRMKTNFPRNVLSFGQALALCCKLMLLPSNWAGVKTHPGKAKLINLSS